MSGFWAFIGFAAVSAAVLIPILVVLTFGAGSKQGTKMPAGNWIKQLRFVPEHFVDSFTKIRPK
jgi:hypothetical protein